MCSPAAYPLSRVPRRSRSVAVPCCRSPRSAAEWGKPCSEWNGEHVSTRHSLAETEAEEAGLTWRNCGDEAHKGGEETCPGVAHTWTCFPHVLPSSVQPRQACPRSRSEGKGVSYRYGARGGPGAFVKTSWARAPSRRKNAGNGVCTPVRNSGFISFGRKKAVRLHCQRFCGRAPAVSCG